MLSEKSLNQRRRGDGLKGRRQKYKDYKEDWMTTHGSTKLGPGVRGGKHAESWLQLRLR